MSKFFSSLWVKLFVVSLFALSLAGIFFYQRSQRDLPGTDADSVLGEYMDDDLNSDYDYFDNKDKYDKTRTDVAEDSETTENDETNGDHETNQTNIDNQPVATVPQQNQQNKNNSTPANNTPSDNSNPNDDQDNAPADNSDDNDNDDQDKDNNGGQNDADDGDSNSGTDGDNDSGDTADYAQVDYERQIETIETDYVPLGNYDIENEPSQDKKDNKHTNYIGNLESAESYLGILFHGKLPKNIDIEQAEIVFTNNTGQDQVSEVKLEVYLENNTNPNTFNPANSPVDRNLTSSKTTVEQQKEWKNGENWYIDVTDQINELQKSSSPIKNKIALVVKAIGEQGQYLEIYNMHAKSKDGNFDISTLPKLKLKYSSNQLPLPHNKTIKITSEDGQASATVLKGTFDSDYRLEINKTGQPDEFAQQYPENVFIGNVYDYRIYDKNNQEINQFEKDIKIDIKFDRSKVTAGQESIITNFYLDTNQNQWIRENTTVDLDQNIASSLINHFTNLSTQFPVLDSLGYPFAQGDTWCVMRGYNYGSHVNGYMNPNNLSQFALDLIKKDNIAQEYNEESTKNAPVYAITDSTVVTIVKQEQPNSNNDGSTMATHIYDDGKGNVIKISYAHIQNIKYKSGDKIKKGDLIAEVWKEGANNVVHLDIHMQRMIDGVWQEPIEWNYGVWNLPNREANEKETNGVYGHHADGKPQKCFTNKNAPWTTMNGPDLINDLTEKNYEVSFHKGTYFDDHGYNFVSTENIVEIYDAQQQVIDQYSLEEKNEPYTSSFDIALDKLEFGKKYTIKSRSRYVYLLPSNHRVEESTQEKISSFIYGIPQPKIISPADQTEVFLNMDDISPSPKVDLTWKVDNKYNYKLNLIENDIHLPPFRVLNFDAKDISGNTFTYSALTNELNDYPNLINLIWQVSANYEIEDKDGNKQTFESVYDARTVRLLKPTQHEDYPEIRMNGIATVPLYRFYSEQFQDHFYTTSNRDKSRTVNTNPYYKFEGVVSYLPKPVNGACINGSTRLYRMYNPTNNLHFYTTNESEYQIVVNDGYVLEDELLCAYNDTNQGADPVYRFINNNNRAHFYTAFEDEKNNVIANLSSVYTLENAGNAVFYAFNSSCDENKLCYVHRLYNLKDEEYFYTIDLEESLNAITKYNAKYELSSFFAYEPDESKMFVDQYCSYMSDLKPVYRFYSDKSSAHFYTIDKDEKAKLDLNFWNYDEGVAFCARTSPASNTLPIYRIYRDHPNNTLWTHLYTTSMTEVNEALAIPKGYWILENDGQPVFYGFKK